MEIVEFAFTDNGLKNLTMHHRGQNWPVVYIINSDKPSKRELYVGTGRLRNPRKGITTNGSILYDIHMDQELPEYLMEDFKWIA